MAFDAPARLFISLQHKLFYVVMSLARFNLYALSYGHLFKRVINEGFRGKRRARGGQWAFTAEVTGIVFFWIWFGRVLYGCGSWPKAIMYLLVSHIVTSPLHVQVTFIFLQVSNQHP
jgi:sphingolipid 8-(E)-desaturase